MAEKSTIARPYAKAAFKYAVDRGQLQQWAEMLVASSAAVSDEKVAAHLFAPKHSKQDRVKFLVKLVGGDFSEEMRSLLALLSENHRLCLLPEILTLYNAFRAVYESTAEVELSSVVPIAEKELEKFKKALTTRLGKEVSLKSEVDESLLGGAIIRAGDLVIDGSIKGQLSRLKELLIG